VTSWRQYEAFGNSAGGSSGTPTNRLANTREKDAASGLYNHGFRYYDPLTGRYVSRDPIGYGDGMNLYQYVGGNPVNGFDPVGLRRDRVWYENLWIWAKTGMWDPADNIVEHVDRYISRDANLAGKIGVVLAQGAVETANFAGDLAFVVDEAARSGGRADAELVSQVVASGLAAEQAQQVASGEWSMWEGTKDASMMNPVSQTIKGGLEIGTGIRMGDTDRIAEGIVSVVGSTYGTSKATHSKPIRLQVPDESLTPVTMGKGTLTVEMAAKGGAKAVGKEPNRIYSARELVRRSEAGDSFHNFPESFNKSIFSGNRQVISDDYVLYTQRGTINDAEGTFQIGVRPSASGRTEVITHRFFKPDK
jgi:RHS repeat-associated protein